MFAAKKRFDAGKMKKLYTLLLLLPVLLFSGKVAAQQVATADSVPATATDSTLYSITDTTAMAADSLAMATDSVDIFARPQLTKRELKREIRDSIRARKDSIIRATPRLLDTYLFGGEVTNQRMFVWTTDGYFNNPTVINPDTTYNDNFHELPYLKDDAGAVYLGVAGSAMLPYNYFKREELDLFPSASLYLPYTYDIKSMPFYNVKTPYTELAYWGTLFANKRKEETNIKFLHTQNFTPALNFNILYKRVGSNGMLEHESTDNRTFAITGNYLGKRYIAQAGYIFNSVKRNENGGVADLSMIMDTIVDLRTVPVRLNDASSKYKKNTIFLTHSYGIPIRFRKNDTTAVGEGTMAYIGHTGEFSTYSRSYDDNIALTDSVAREFYNNKFYLNPTTTADSIRVMNLDNRFFIKLQPWAREAIVSGLEGGIGYQRLFYYKFSPDMLLRGNYNIKENNLYLYFGANGSFKQYFNWEGFGEYYLAGYNKNDFSIEGKIGISLYPISQGIHVTGKIKVLQRRPGLFYNNYYSNHYIWQNDFNKSTATSFEGRISVPAYKLEAFFGYSLLNDNIYLDTLGNAVQNNESMSIVTAWLRKDFKLWKLHLENKILFQHSSRQEVVPLPKLALNLRYYLEFNLVKNVLDAQIGADATFNTNYYAQAYSPALGLFYNQRDEKIGGTPYIDIFINLQWKRASVFVKLVNVGQDWPDSDYFSANRYVKSQTALKFGIHWPFYLR